MNPEDFYFDSLNLIFKPSETHKHATEIKAKFTAGFRYLVFCFDFISISTSRILLTPV